MSHPFLHDRHDSGRRPLTIPVADPHTTSREAAEVADPIMHVEFPWLALHDLTGPLLPGSLTVVSARTGSGKTLFIRNWLHWLAREDRPGVAYFPTETPVREVLRGIICAELGVNPVDIARGDFSRIEGGQDAFRAFALETAKRLQTPRGALVGPPLALYDHPRPNLGVLAATLKEAAEQGVSIAVIDHLLRLDLGDGTQLFAEVTAGVRQLKMLAESLGMAIVVTSQQGRAAFAGDRLAAFAPPDLSALKGSGAIEEEADLVLFLHRLLRDDLTAEQTADVRKGRIPLQDVVAPNLMGAAIGKHRLDGAKTGAACRLWVEHGRVTDLPESERLAWEAQRHGISTGRTL